MQPTPRHLRKQKHGVVVGTVRAGLPPLEAQGTPYFGGPFWGGPHWRRNNFSLGEADYDLAVKKLVILSRRFDKISCFLCERRRRERKFSISKSSVAAVRWKLAYCHTLFESWGPPNARGPRPVPCVPCGWSVTEHSQQLLKNACTSRHTRASAASK